jgi:hypothetical protein
VGFSMGAQWAFYWGALYSVWCRRSPLEYL